jgi:DNA-binding GntR family transcriptional regulator
MANSPNGGTGGRYRAGTIRPRSTAERRVLPYEKMKQAILAGEILPGEPLVENSLAEWCGVSRTPIREALMRLEQDGLVKRVERGLIVRESSPEEILDLYDTRIVLESKAAAVAAERRTSHDLMAMRRALQRTAAGDVSEAQRLAENNRTFHRAVWRASHNEALIDLLERLNLHLGRYPATTLIHPGRLESAYQQHSQLVDAVDARDADRAAAIATQHFSEARDIRLKLWEDE